MTEVYLGLGSNLESPLNQLKQAIDTLKSSTLVDVKEVSSFYQSAPWGLKDQPDFINATLKLTTSLQPLELLDFLQQVEKKQKRQRSLKWGARTLDLDILLFGSLQLHLPRLILPHPYLLERAFVVYPLAEIAPNLKLPGVGLLKEALLKCPVGDLIKLDEVCL